MMHTALIPVFIREFNLTIFEAGLLVSIPLALSVSMSLPYGFITDRVDPRKLMILSLLMSGLSGLAVSQARSFLTLSTAVLHTAILNNLSSASADHSK